ncbi:MAG: HIT domain-containing protein [Thermodesulfobacteriota bacterium]
MEYLWAPWRMDYILKEKREGCIFCEKPRENKDKKNLILFRGEDAFVIMNKFPYNSGHLMVVPRRHCVDLVQLDDREIHELARLLRASSRILRECLHPHGFNIGMNIGKVGGAGEEHIHFHVVPRWEGDINFMPVLSETKVIPEYLGKTYDKLHAAFKGLSWRKRGRKGGQER